MEKHIEHIMSVKLVGQRQQKKKKQIYFTYWRRLQNDNEGIRYESIRET